MIDLDALRSFGKQVEVGHILLYSRLMFIRRCLAAGTTALLVAVAAPAHAAPAQVSLVSFTGASTTSLKLSWPKVSGASAYEVFRSERKDMSGATRVSRTSSNSASITRMRPGKTYCFQVRALARSAPGRRSARTCKPTIRKQSPVSGASYAVMTLNACSEVCSDWATRSSAATAVVRNRLPDVVALQEAGAWKTPPAGYANAVSKSAKRLFYKTSRFTLAIASGRERVGNVVLSAGKYAVWAELIDRQTGKRIIFASVHTSSALSDYARRGSEVETLLNRMTSINTARLPVVYAGDFNSHKNRGIYDEGTGFGVEDTVNQTFARAGFYDSYDLARTLQRPNWNSFSGFLATPTTSKTWGDHVDHVYIEPGRSNVFRWMNAALYSGDQYATPIPSDHSAVQVDLYIS